MTVTSVLAALLGSGSPGPAAAVPALIVRRCRPEDGPAYWRWDCRRCGEYGGGGNHPDAMLRAMRHCGEHPEHRSSLVPPVRCRERRLAVHPALFATAEDEFVYLADGPPLDG